MRLSLCTVVSVLSSWGLGFVLCVIFFPSFSVLKVKKAQGSVPQDGRPLPQELVLGAGITSVTTRTNLIP